MASLNILGEPEHGIQRRMSAWRRYGHRNANPHLARQREYRQELERAVETKQCPFCEGGTSFRNERPLLADDGLGLRLYQNNHPSRRVVRLEGDPGGDYANGGFAKHFVTYGVSPHLEGIEQLSHRQIVRWWQLISHAAEARRAGEKPERVVIYFKEGDADWNSATINHLHGQIFALNPDDSMAPLIPCCVRGELLEPVAQVMGAGDFKTCSPEVACLPLVSMLSENSWEDLGWKVEMSTCDSYRARWQFKQVYGSSRSFTELANNTANLLALYSVVVKTLHEYKCPGGVFMLFQEDGQPGAPIVAQYLWMRPDKAVILAG